MYTRGRYVLTVGFLFSLFFFFFFYDSLARAMEEMELRHQAKMAEVNGLLAAKDQEAGSVRSKLEEAEKESIRQKEALSASASAAAKAAEAKIAAEITKMKEQLEAKDKELNSVKTEVTGLRKAANENSDAQARLKDLAKQKEALEKEKQMMALELSNLKVSLSFFSQ